MPKGKNKSRAVPFNAVAAYREGGKAYAQVLREAIIECDDGTRLSAQEFAKVIDGVLEGFLAAHKAAQNKEVKIVVPGR